MYRVNRVLSFPFRSSMRCIHDECNEVASLSARGRTPLDAQVLVYPAIDGRDWARPCSAGFWDPACNENAESLLAGRRV